jgi:hypothetical protein
VTSLAGELHLPPQARVRPGGHDRRIDDQACAQARVNGLIERIHEEKSFCFNMLAFM